MINLLPQATRAERDYGRKNRKMVAYTVAIFLTAGLVALIMVGSIQFVGRDAAEIQQTISDNETEITVLERDIKDLRDVANRLTAADKLYDQSITFSEIVPQIASILPQGTIINGLTLTGGNTDPLALNVRMTDASLAAVLQRNLIESDLFEAADVDSISSTGEESSYRFTASVNVSFTGSAEAKRKAKAAEAAAAAAAAEAAAGEEE